MVEGPTEQTQPLPPLPPPPPLGAAESHQPQAEGSVSPPAATGRRRTNTRDLEALLEEVPTPKQAELKETLRTFVSRGGSFAKTLARGAVALASRSRAFGEGLFRAAAHTVISVRENIQREREIRELLQDLLEDKRRLTEALESLGRAVLAAPSEHPALAEELAAIRSIQERIEAAQRERNRIGEKRVAKAQEFEATLTRRRSELAEREDALRQVLGKLEAVKAERQELQGHLRKTESELASLSKEVGAKEAEILRAETPEKQAELRREVEHLRTQGAALEPERDELSAKIAQLDEELAGLERTMRQAQAEVDASRRALEEVERERSAALAAVDTDAERREAEIALYTKEIARHEVTLGNICQQHRDELPEFESAYAEIDRISEELSQHLERVGQLREEIQSSFKPPFAQGVAVLLSGLGLLVLLALLLGRAACS